MPFAITRFGIQVAALIAGAGVLVTSCVVRDRSVEQRGAAKVVSASKKAGAKANATNREVRRRAAEPGAFERLLEESCRDCGP
ncbi:hypothetical protein [Denitromonas sp.]|uniref:hypothetical protein n=1 Tax=Denitromonas sp. TaxID=2734609 RepID=UPI002C532344|nr:hypothetical protein [Gammaproteobacteria bacterium]